MSGKYRIPPLLLSMLLAWYRVSNLESRQLPCNISVCSRHVPRECFSFVFAALTFEGVGSLMIAINCIDMTENNARGEVIVVCPAYITLKISSVSTANSGKPSLPSANFHLIIGLRYVPCQCRQQHHQLLISKNIAMCWMSRSTIRTATRFRPPKTCTLSMRLPRSTLTFFLHRPTTSDMSCSPRRRAFHW
jgi:hypothetical protein